MKKIVALAVLAFVGVLASGCGSTDSENGATNSEGEKIGTCMISLNGSCQEYEDLNNYTVETLKSECENVGVWNESPCPTEYSSGCKSISTGLNGGTYVVSILYKKDNPFYNNVKRGCEGEWIEK